MQGNRLTMQRRSRSMQRNPDSVGKCNSEESKRLEVGNHFIGLRFVQIAEGRHLTFAFRNDCSHNDVGGLWLMIAEVPFESGTRQRGCRMNAMAGCAIAREGLLSLSNRLCGFRLVRPGRAPDGEHPRNAGAYQQCDSYLSSFHNDASSRRNGSRRKRLPVAAKSALATTGAASVTPSSPIPPGSR